MQIGNRIFPYPVLNQDLSFSDYLEDFVFRLEFEFNNDGNPIIKNREVIFKNLHYTLNNPTLLSLIEEGKLKGAFIVECSKTVFREKFDISTSPYDLHISTNNIDGDVICSCYLYATENILGFRSDDFLQEYSEYTFDIDRFDILAVDDGFKLIINHDPTEDDKVASIFMVVRKESDNDILTYSNDDKNIVIQLPKTYYDAYNNIKKRSENNNISFAMLAIPVLARCMDECNQYESIEDIIDHHTWFKSVCVSYKRKNGQELLFEEFLNTNKLELAQIVLNSASCNGLKDFDNMLFVNNKGADNEDE